MSVCEEPVITVENLTMAYGSFVVQKNLNFTINRGDVFVIIGGSGCGKTTLMQHLVGLQRPAGGQVFYGQESLWEVSVEARQRILRQTGILFQAGALWTSMTLAENVMLPLAEYTELSERQMRQIASLKLALVGLAGYDDHFPAEISGGMVKRAGLARAMALDPEILFFDEPSAGLDPVTSKRLDDLVHQLRDSLGSTIVMVTHELSQIYALSNNCIYLDNVRRTITAEGNPRTLVRETKDPLVEEFMTRGGTFPVNTMDTASASLSTPPCELPR